jgi:hypothetical protein
MAGIRMTASWSQERIMNTGRTRKSLLGGVGRADAKRSQGAKSGLALSRAATRLLAALAEPGAIAGPDPAEEGRVLLRAAGAGSGVSLGRGAFPLAAAEELVAADLAARAGTGRYAISEPGRAHLARSRSGPDGEGFRAQHLRLVAGEVATETGPAKVTLNAAESPLAWLRRRKDRDGEPFLDAAAFEAGERLRRDLTFGGVLPSVSARWDGAVSGTGGAMRDPAGATDAMVAARQRVRKCLDAVGPDFADLLLDLCGFLKGLEEIERDRGWPPRSGKVVVRLALRRLADHYGLGSEARGPASSRGLRSWAAEGDAGAG